MLLRFDPFRELDRMTEAAWPGYTNRTAPSIPMDAVRVGDKVTVQFDLPGVDPASIDLEVERNVLTLRAERRWTRPEDAEVLASERRQGQFTRQLLLGDTLDGEAIKADYRDGVLELTIPVAEAAKPRKVSIGTDSSAKPIEAHSTEAA
jgi:HSP20 family protein